MWFFLTLKENIVKSPQKQHKKIIITVIACNVFALFSSNKER